ncbi:short chain dehydrogenase/reductase [Sporothrix brasiliensis 5110]|uniref:Short chain dehydrogenase/reductase n=1 Tax=Sporothrix brasiliensis 5110 TaxID=1398154 RepID=A0A0C2IB00_9PEZI|nr:short chain dehydrogenase/reductase [Sporothrix brasiliensis 5110]KIH86426.1 short chain dehydrogenase/reductase [Sporothrix brasiliensis 5110]
MPTNVDIDPAVLAAAAGQTVIITGAAGGIGAATAVLFSEHGANVVIADLASARTAATETLIPSLAHPERAVFVPVDILNWADMQALFKTAVATFGRVDVVVANAGIMETAPVLDMDAVDAAGDLLESREAFQVLDVNIKGTLNTIRLGIHTMRRNERKHNAKDADAKDLVAGSIVLIASTSGYFGGTSVAGYITSKHGVVGLLRSCRATATQHGIRINAVAPFFTPTHITASYAEAWQAAGLEANTPRDVAGVIAQQALNTQVTGTCVLACGRIRRELETTRAALVGQWMGEDVTDLMARAGQLFAELGGYPLPKKREA